MTGGDTSVQLIIADLYTYAEESRNADLQKRIRQLESALSIESRSITIGNITGSKALAVGENIQVFLNENANLPADLLKSLMTLIDDLKQRAGDGKEEHSLKRYLDHDIANFVSTWYRSNSKFDFHPQNQFVIMKAAWNDGVQAEDILDDLLGILERNKRARIAISANYGQGKTFLGWKLVLSLASQSAQARIPFFYPLKNLSLHSSINYLDQISIYIQENFPGINFKDILLKHSCLLILDGADEIPAGLSSLQMGDILKNVLNDFDQFQQLAILVSFRTALFQKGLQGFLDKFPAYQGAILLPWDRFCWSQLLKQCDETGFIHFKKGWKYFRDEVIKRPALLDLTTRPLWCRMIIETRDTILSSDVSTEAKLYQFYIEQYFLSVRTKARTQLFVDVNDKIRVLEILSQELLRRRATFLDDAELLSAARKAFDVPDGKFREFIGLDLCTYSLLNYHTFQGTPLYSFDHSSFQDFFAARSVIRDISSARVKHNISLLASLFGKKISEGFMGFMTGILRNDNEALMMLRHILCADPIVIFGGRSNEIDLVRKGLLTIWIHYCRSISNEIPVDLIGFRLDQMNLEKMDLSFCDMRSASLNNSNLEWTDLKNADLSEAKCYNTRFTHADLTGATINQVDISKATGLQNREGDSNV